MKNSHDGRFKSRVALEALRGELTIVRCGSNSRGIPTFARTSFTIMRAKR